MTYGLTKKVNSREKGAEGERRLAEEFRKFGYEDAYRTQQFCGKNGDADVSGVSDLLHIESKVYDNGHGKTYEWMEQAKNDAREGEIPIVCHKRQSKKVRGKSWLVTMELDDFMRMFRAYEKEWSEGE